MNDEELELKAKQIGEACAEAYMRHSLSGFGAVRIWIDEDGQTRICAATEEEVNAEIEREQKKS